MPHQYINPLQYSIPFSAPSISIHGHYRTEIYLYDPSFFTLRNPIGEVQTKTTPSGFPAFMPIFLSRQFQFRTHPKLFFSHLNSPSIKVGYPVAEGHGRSRLGGLRQPTAPLIDRREIVLQGTCKGFEEPIRNPKGSSPYPFCSS